MVYGWRVKTGVRGVGWGGQFGDPGLQRAVLGGGEDKGGVVWLKADCCDGVEVALKDGEDIGGCIAGGDVVDGDAGGTGDGEKEGGCYGDGSGA